jgi:hypothetical protein
MGLPGPSIAFVGFCSGPRPYQRVSGEWGKRLRPMPWMGGLEAAGHWVLLARQRRAAAGSSGHSDGEPFHRSTAPVRSSTIQFSSVQFSSVQFRPARPATQPEVCCEWWETKEEREDESREATVWLGFWPGRFDSRTNTRVLPASTLTFQRIGPVSPLGTECFLNTIA